MPRSASLDLTVDMFGSSVDLLEIGGRVEGADYLLEKYLSDKDVNDVVRRQKRDVIPQSNLDNLDASVSSFHSLKIIYRNLPCNLSGAW